MTKQKFRAEAKPVTFACPDAGPIKAVPVATKAGALGWVGQCDLLVLVGGEWVKVSASIRLTSVTSKTWPEA
jgi:epoxyqueuosine reductase QueG